MTQRLLYTIYCHFGSENPSHSIERAGLIEGDWIFLALLWPGVFRHDHDAFCSYPRLLYTADMKQVTYIPSLALGRALSHALSRTHGRFEVNKS